jgi:MoaA/NifB/PqqE/SkfB family radical SAM enzyme
VIVLWRATTACNLACGFCAYDRRLPFARSHVDPMEAERFGAVLGAWSRARGEPVLVSWLGGEPLGWPPLVEVGRELHDDLGLDLAVTTNGTRLATPAVQAELLARYAEVTVSVDGVGDVHDRLRGWPGGFAHLARAVSALADARARRGGGPRLRVNTVLVRETVDDLVALCRAVAGWGVDEVTFNPLGGNDRPAFFAEHRLTEAQARRIADQLPAWQAELAAIGLSLRGGAAYRARLLATARGERLAVADCRPGERTIFVDEQGRVAPCSFTGDAYALAADELADGAGAIAALPARWRTARAAGCHRACADCHQTTVFEKFAPGPGAREATAP